ncbi:MULTISPECIES: ABC transporter ATP-binding protein [Streptomyces]|uniref:ABC transporter ATP-binding protein n=1 Tax=Streptomyces TaxID=1883 RepID=UPI0016451FFF|nr:MULTISPECIES: ABC transporter ATP-binding protein [Streptomyces]MBT3074982.1 ATP-binding cassette domain-containing protein [Streptomyces sp. COG21]MBT3089574.1 ATP-binding cassette domain-containing protein [Streptomyces sp. CYG21]MBT3097873.1 ATP-binding cassette domain-containing protein [Streptomyces sp. CBG30]MBT3103809.1 ATP-binding cassette domain-containing protein [Streptomyces sp. COG19]MBT3113218.1 ATP-binding cassette domain-containing protein [Streptomyces sp. CYG20]
MTPRTPEGKTSEPTTREGLRLLAGCLRDRPALAALAVVGGLVYQLALIALPWFIERAVDQGIVSGDGSALRRWALVIIGAGILAALAEMVLGWYSTLLATTQGNRLYIALADRVAGLDTRTLARFGEGDLGMRGTRDVDLVRTWLSGFASFVTGVGGFVVMIVAIMRLDPLLAVVCVLCVPPLVWINTYWFPKRFGAANTRLSAAHGSRADAVEELLSASAAVRGLGGEPALVRRHHERSATVTEHTLATGRVSADWAALSPFVPALAIGAGLGLGGLAVLRGTMSVGGIVAFTSWMSMLVLWVGVITLRVSQLSQATTAARRLQDVLLPGPTDRAEGTRPLPTSGDLTAEGISHLVDGHRILAPVDLTVRPGELVAVTGPTGSGKTTLLRVLAGLQPPTGGTVSFGGVPLAAADTAELHARIGYVPQRPVTLSGTLADNLRLGAPYTDDELREACRTAALDGYLDSAPDGLDTLVGERGSTLSGGQLQRLALARAVLRRPAVLLLDDITSAIDTTTERALLERLRAWSGTTAIVCATHRATFIDAADRTLALTPARSAAPDDVTEERVSTGG